MGLGLREELFELICALLLPGVLDLLVHLLANLLDRLGRVEY